MCSVWNAPATRQRRSAGPWPAGRRRARRAAPRCRRRRSGRGRCRWRRSGRAASIAASTSSRSPPRTAVMLVGGDRGGRGHRLAALAHQHHRLLGGDRPGAGGGGELADAVAGDRADRLEGVGGVREELEGGEQAGGDQQRLGDGGVADRRPRRPRCRSARGRGRRPRRASAAARRTSGPRARASRKPGVWAPWPGATMASTPLLCRAGGPIARSTHTKIAGAVFVGTLQSRLRAAVPSSPGRSAGPASAPPGRCRRAAGRSG